MTMLLETMKATRPRLTRVFGDEDAFVILGSVVGALKEIGRAVEAPGSEIAAAVATVRAEMMAGDYEALLSAGRVYVKFADDEED